MSKTQRILNLILGLILIAFAVVLFLEPQSGPLAILLILGAELVLSGIYTLYFYITMARHMVGGKKTFYRGILLLDMGALLLSGYSGQELLIHLYLLALFAVAGGIDLVRALESRKQNAPWKHRLLSGLLCLAVLILGIVFMREQTAMVYIFCIALLYLGLSRILSAFQKTEILDIPQ